MHPYQTDPDLAALSNSSNSSSSADAAFTSSAASATTGVSSNTSQQSFFDHTKPTAMHTRIAASVSSNVPSTSPSHPGTPRKARSRQTTYENETLKPPSPNDALRRLSGSGSRKNSWAGRHDINGTIMREGDVGNGMHTIRPVKRFDSINSNRASAEFIRHSDTGRRSNSGSTMDGSAPPSPSMSTESGVIGRAMVEEVVNPVLEHNINSQENELSPEDVETISLISNGFSDLAESNPELTYQIILDLLNGINEHELIRKHIMGSSSGLLARNTVKHRSTKSKTNVAAELEAAMNEEDSGSEADSISKTDSTNQQRGPVAEMLYSRWLEVSSNQFFNFHLDFRAYLSKTASFRDFGGLLVYIE